MRIIVVTGGIACGKTTVGNYLRDRWGCSIIDSDAIARQMQTPGSATLSKIIRTFGPAFQNPDGTLNRKKLGDLIFSDRQARAKLDSIVHPAVFRELTISVLKRWLYRDQFVVLDIPLFFETHLSSKYFHEIVTVAIDPDEQVRRVMLRNNLSETDARARVSAQIPIEEKCRMATLVLRNDASQDELHQTLDRCVEKWNKRAWLTYLPDPLLVLLLLLLIVAIIVKIRI
jgi:dephospho-CoA kinase